MRRPQAELDALPTTLYRAYDSDGQLLYIGIAVNWAARWDKHRQRSPWFSDVARVDVMTYQSRSDAAAAEAAAIKLECPKHNIEHTDKDTRPAHWRNRKADMTDRLSAAESNLSPTSLVGSYFHSGATPGWQGCVVALAGPGVYLVELFSWLHGGSTEQRLVRLDRMVDEGWHFYDDAEWASDHYDAVIRQQWQSDRNAARSGDL